MASLNNRTESMKILLKAGADPNYVTRDGDTPLTAASDQGHTKIVEILLKAGANPNYINEDGDTPLSEASDQGHTKIVELLKLAQENQRRGVGSGNFATVCYSLSYKLKIDHLIGFFNCWNHQSVQVVRQVTRIPSIAYYPYPPTNIHYHQREVSLQL